jgi:hypothetical protein
MRSAQRQWLTAGGWVLVIVASRVLGLVPLPLVLGALGLWAFITFGRRLFARGGRARPPPTSVVRGTVEPPSARHAYKPPTTLLALTRRLEDADLGPVTSTADSVRVELTEGAWAMVQTPNPARVTQTELRLEGSSVEALALTCDALASELGAMCLRVEGVELVIDGTRPRGLLRNDVADAVDTHLRRLRAERRRLERPPTGTTLH